MSGLVDIGDGIRYIVEAHRSTDGLRLLKDAQVATTDAATTDAPHTCEVCTGGTPKSGDTLVDIGTGPRQLPQPTPF